MENFLNFLLDNPVYLIIGAILALILLGAILKRVIKLAVFVLVLLLLYFGYLYVTGKEIPKQEKIKNSAKKAAKKVETGMKNASKRIKNLEDDLDIIKKKAKESEKNN